MACSSALVAGWDVRYEFGSKHIRNKIIYHRLSVISIDFSKKSLQQMFTLCVKFFHQEIHEYFFG